MTASALNKARLKVGPIFHAFWMMLSLKWWKKNPFSYICVIDDNLQAWFVLQFFGDGPFRKIIFEIFGFE